MPLFSYITLPATATQDLLAYTGGLTTDLWSLISLAIGIPLAFYIISRIIGLVRTHTGRVR